MSGDFPGSGGTGPPYISMTAGGAGAVGTGDYTMVALVQPAGNCGVMSAYASTTLTREILIDSGAVFGLGDFSSGWPTVTPGNWYVMGQSKAAGSNTYRHHLWQYASDGSGTMSHGVSTGSGTHGDGSTITELRVGSNDNRANGLIAVVAYWDRVLSDAELDSLKSPNLSAWTAVSGGAPKALISLQNWNGTTGAADVVGTSTFSGVTGTVNVGADPPSFNYSLAAAAAPAGARVPLPPPLLYEVALRNQAQWQQPTAYAATGAGTAAGRATTQAVAAKTAAATARSSARAASAAAGAKTEAATASSSARAAVTATGVKGAAAAAGPLAHPATAQAGAKQAAAAATAPTRTATAAVEGSNNVSGAAAALARTSTAAATVKKAAQSAAAAARAVVAATGVKKTLGTATPSARPSTAAAGARAARGTATAAGRALTSSTGTQPIGVLTGRISGPEVQANGLVDYQPVAIGGSVE